MLDGQVPHADVLGLVQVPKRQADVSNENFVPTVPICKDSLLDRKDTKRW